MIEFLSFLCSGPEVYPPSTVYASKSDSSGSPVPVSVSHYNPVTSLSPAPGSPEAAAPAPPMSRPCSQLSSLSTPHLSSQTTKVSKLRLSSLCL